MEFKYVGRRIYFLKINGTVIYNTGNSYGFVKEHNFDEEYDILIDLKKYKKDAIDFIDLKYNEFETEFRECTGYHVDVAKKEIIFEYGEKPNPPEVPIKPSLHERMDAVEKANSAQDDIILDNAYRVAILELGTQGVSL